MWQNEGKPATPDGYQQKLEELRWRIDLLPVEQRPHLHKMANVAEQQHQHRLDDPGGVGDMVSDLRLLKKHVEADAKAARRQARAARRHRRSRKSNFAEFLNQSYLAHLSILYLSTCVGLGYGHHVNSLDAFLGGMGVQWRRLIRLGIAPQTYGIRIFLDPVLHAYPGSTIARVHLPFRVPSLLTYYQLGR